MVRPLRLEFPGALWHVTNRGVERRLIYSNDRDRFAFLALVRRAVLHRGWALHAYVLMTNHYHLLLSTPREGLSAGMQDIDGNYAAIFNRRTARVGHLFGGRFKSHLVDSETYLLEVARYVVLNPVRAGMVEDPARWRWSSYHATAGLASIPQWLDVSAILDKFDADNWTEAAVRYREFVRIGLEHRPNPWEHLVDGRFLGSLSFVTAMRDRALREGSPAGREKRVEALRHLLNRSGLADCWPPPPRSEARSLFVLVASRSAKASRSLVGSILGITGQAAGRLLATARRREETDASFAEQVRDLEAALLAAEED